MKTTVRNFINEFKTKKIQNTKTDNTIVGKYIRDTLQVKTYIPFREKRAIVETIVEQNIEVVDGIKRHDSINGYVSFVMAMLKCHTTLEFEEDPVADYDLLAESGLLPLIIEEFRASYDESDILLKMALAAELEDNNVNVLIGKFLDGLSKKLEGISEALKDKLLSTEFGQEDLAKLKSLLNK